MSKPRDQVKEQFWRQTLADWQQSGLSVTAFCRQHQLQPQSFFRWRKLLELRDQPDASPCQASIDAAAASPLFVPVQLRPAVPAAASATFEVVLRTGRLLRLAPGFDPTCLRQLLALLEETPC
jgi:transposase-like protein